MKNTVKKNSLILISLISAGISFATDDVSSSEVKSATVLAPYEIVEASNGRCRKWDDGQMECWGSTDLLTKEDTTVTYPVPFKSGSSIATTSANDTSKIHVTVSSKSRSGYLVSTGKSGNVGPNDNTYFTISKQDGANNIASWQASGYWK